jgi:hypothetical protein
VINLRGEFLKNYEGEGGLLPCVSIQFKEKEWAFPLIVLRNKKEKAVDFSRTSKKVDRGT